MVTNMDIMVTLGELWHTKPSVLWSLLTPSVLNEKGCYIQQFESRLKC